jgi:hypothetical protein
MPALAIGDGALGFWAALREVFPLTKEQLCWLHKTRNLLDKLPKSRPKRRPGCGRLGGLRRAAQRKSSHGS